MLFNGGTFSVSRFSNFESWTIAADTTFSGTAGLNGALKVNESVTLYTDGLDFSGDNTSLTGDLEISGSTTISGKLTVENEAGISGAGLSLTGGTLEVKYGGLVDAAVNGGDGADTLINNGIINNDVDLGGGDDTLSWATRPRSRPP